MIYIYIYIYHLGYSKCKIIRDIYFSFKVINKFNKNNISL